MGNAQRLPDGLLLSHLSGLYYAEWVRRGPAWVIATTITVAFSTTNIIVGDMGSQCQHALLNLPGRSTRLKKVDAV